MSRSRPTRAKRLGYLAAAVSLGLLAGCAGAAGQPGSETGSASKVLRVVLQGEPQSLNPVFSVFSDARAWYGIYDGLVGLDKATLAPTADGLLTEWKQTAPTEWVFKVRQGVKFQNGEPFDANAAAFTIKELRDNPKSILRGYYDVVVDAKADGADLKVTTTEPYAAMPRLLSNAYAIPPVYYAKVGAKEFAQKPVGTGPYALDSYTSGQAISLKKFDGYWGGKPALDGMRLTWSSEASSRAALLTSGDADMVFDVQPQDAAQLESNDKFRLVRGQTAYGLILFQNTNSPVLKDVKLREAISKAVDRDGIVKAIFQGVGAVPSYTFVGDLLNKPMEAKVGYDPAAAASLVQGTGAKPKIVFGYTSGRFPNDAKVGAAISAMLEKAGFQVDQRAEEYGAYRKQRDQGAYDIFMQEFFPVFSHPDSFVSYFLGEGATLKSCVNGAQYDALSTKGLTATTPEESDAAYSELETNVLTKDYCYVPVTKTVYSYGMTKNLSGFDKGPRDAAPYYSKMSLK